MTIFKYAFVLALTVSAALAQIFTPQGRLTLQTNTPVMTQDVVSTGTVYYTPYVGNNLPKPNGSGGYTNSTFSQLGWGSTTGLTHSSVYDMFAYNNSGSWVLCVGPAWSSSSSRGSGAGTTEITQVGGILVNAQAISACRNNINAGNFSYSVAANLGVYLGSLFLDNSWTVTMSLHPAAGSGGAVCQLGLWNAYNRVRVTAYNRDSKSNWTYSTASWRAADNSAGNVIQFLDGLQQSQVTASYSIMGTTTADTVGAYIGLNVDTTTTTPDIASQATSAAGQTSASQPNVKETFYPLLGFHYIQAVEYATGTSAQFFGSNASQQLMALTVSLDM